MQADCGTLFVDEFQVRYPRELACWSSPDNYRAQRSTDQPQNTHSNCIKELGDQYI